MPKNQTSEANHKSPNPNHPPAESSQSQARGCARMQWASSLKCGTPFSRDSASPYLATPTLASKWRSSRRICSNSAHSAYILWWRKTARQIHMSFPRNQTSEPYLCIHIYIYVYVYIYTHLLHNILLNFWELSQSPNPTWQQIRHQRQTLNKSLNPKP